MRSLVAPLVVASLAYLGTMADNFVAFSAQLALTDGDRHRRAAVGQVTAVVAMVLVALAVGRSLHAIPLGWFGLLALAPFSFAVHAWRTRAAPRAARRRGGLTTFLVTLSIGGDNVAVWTPLFRAGGLGHVTAVAASFAFWEILFLASSRALARHPRVVDWSVRHAPRALPAIYAALGLLVLVECHLY